MFLAWLSNCIAQSFAPNTVAAQLYFITCSCVPFKKSLKINEKPTKVNGFIDKVPATVEPRYNEVPRDRKNVFSSIHFTQCNRLAGLKNIVRYSGDSVIKGFVISGYHCKRNKGKRCSRSHLRFQFPKEGHQTTNCETRKLVSPY